MGELTTLGHNEVACNPYEMRRIFAAEFLKTITLPLNRSQVEVLDLLMRRTLILMQRKEVEDKAFFYEIYQLWQKKVDPKTVSLNTRFSLKFNISEAANVLKCITWCDENRVPMDVYTNSMLSLISDTIYQQLI